MPAVDIPRARRATSLAVAVLACGLLAGCVTTAGGALGDLTRSSRSAASDLQSISLALALFSDDRSTKAVTGTAIEDSLADLVTLQQSVATLTVDDARERTARSRTLSLLDDALEAGISAKEAVDEVGGAPSVITAHHRAEGAADRLWAWSTRLEKLW